MKFGSEILDEEEVEQIERMTVRECNRCIFSGLEVVSLVGGPSLMIV